MVKKMSGLINVLDFAYYVMEFNKKKTKKSISELKLQLVLFFCFAEWGANVEKSRREGNRIPYSENLFDESFEAFYNGPCIGKVKRLFLQNGWQKKRIDTMEMFWENGEIKSFLDHTLDDYLELSESALLKLAKDMTCWKKHFNNSKKKTIIEKEEIIEEFLNRA